MNMRTALIILACALVAFVVVSQSVFVVHQTQAGIILQLGKPVGLDKAPGLHFKLPFVQNVIFFDMRVMEYGAEQAEILTSDKKTLVVDNYSKWRITDPLKFYQTVRNVPGAQARLDDIIYSQLRVSLGRFTLSDIVASDRPQIMHEVTEKSSALVAEYGLEVVDVRIKRTDLPPENERAIFERMRAERERQAKQYRSEGQEEAAKVKSGADKEKTIILAEAAKQSEILRGEGDAEATRIYAEALKQSPDFYTFKRSLEAYVRSFSDNTRLIITPDSPFLRFLR